MDEFDQRAWRDFFKKHQKFRTLCLNCISKNRDEARGLAKAGVNVSDSDDDPHGFGPIYLREASKALMRLWLIKARERIVAAGPRGRPDVSSDEEDDDLLVAAPWARRPVVLNPASRAIAKKWLAGARARMLTSGGGAGGPRVPSTMAIRQNRIKPDKAPSGRKSRYRRK